MFRKIFYTLLALVFTFISLIGLTGIIELVSANTSSPSLMVMNGTYTVEWMMLVLEIMGLVRFGKISMDSYHLKYCYLGFTFLFLIGAFGLVYSRYSLKLYKR